MRKTILAVVLLALAVSAVYASKTRPTKIHLRDQVKEYYLSDAGIAGDSTDVFDTLKAYIEAKSNCRIIFDTGAVYHLPVTNDSIRIREGVELVGRGARLRFEVSGTGAIPLQVGGDNVSIRGLTIDVDATGDISSAGDAYGAAISVGRSVTGVSYDDIIIEQNVIHGPEKAGGASVVVLGGAENVRVSDNRFIANDSVKNCVLVKWGNTQQPKSFVSGKTQHPRGVVIENNSVAAMGYTGDTTIAFRFEGVASGRIANNTVTGADFVADVACGTYGYRYSSLTSTSQFEGSNIIVEGNVGLASTLSGFRVNGLAASLNSWLAGDSSAVLTAEDVRFDMPVEFRGNGVYGDTGVDLIGGYTLAYARGVGITGGHVCGMLGGVTFGSSVDGLNLLGLTVSGCAFYGLSIDFGEDSTLAPTHIDVTACRFIDNNQYDTTATINAEVYIDNCYTPLLVGNYIKALAANGSTSDYGLHVTGDCREGGFIANVVDSIPNAAYQITTTSRAWTRGWEGNVAGTGVASDSTYNGTAPTPLSIRETGWRDTDSTLEVESGGSRPVVIGGEKERAQITIYDQHNDSAVTAAFADSSLLAVALYNASTSDSAFIALVGEIGATNTAQAAIVFERMTEDTSQVSVWVETGAGPVRAMTVKSDGSVALTNYTLPAADGTNGQQLTTDGSGTLTWASAGGVGTGDDVLTDTSGAGDVVDNSALILQGYPGTVDLDYDNDTVQIVVLNNLLSYAGDSVIFSFSTGDTLLVFPDGSGVTMQVNDGSGVSYADSTGAVTHEFVNALIEAYNEDVGVIVATDSGVTNDSVATDSALNALLSGLPSTGIVVLFPPGKYLLDDTIAVVPNGIDKVTLKGIGYPTFYCSNSLDGGGVLIMAGQVEADSIDWVHEGVITGFRIHDMFADSGWNNGIGFAYGNNCRAYDNRIVRAGRKAFSLHYSIYSKIYDNVVDSAGHCGVMVEHAFDTTDGGDTLLCGYGNEVYNNRIMLIDPGIDTLIVDISGADALGAGIVVTNHGSAKPTMKNNSVRNNMFGTTVDTLDNQTPMVWHLYDTVSVSKSTTEDYGNKRFDEPYSFTIGGDGTVIGGETHNNPETNFFMMLARHYNWAEEPFLVWHATAGTSNIVSVGGGDSRWNAAQRINFYAVDDSATLWDSDSTVWLKMIVDDSGVHIRDDFIVANTTQPTRYHSLRHDGTNAYHSWWYGDYRWQNVGATIGYIDSTTNRFVFTYGAWKQTETVADSALITFGHAKDLIADSLAAFVVTDVDTNGTQINAALGDRASTSGDSYTGSHDFGGASMEIPNGTNPTVDDAGEVSLDTDDGHLRVYPGAQRAIPIVQHKEITIFDPDAVQAIKDAVPLMTVEAGWAPHGITVDSIWVKLDSAYTSYAITLEEWSDPVTATSDMETITVSSEDEGTNSGALTDGTIAAGSIIMVDLPDTDIDWVHVCIRYYVTPGD